MPYLTNSEYIDRFGQAETVALTDEARTGTIDSEKLNEAIEDSAEEVDAYLANRYSIPLASPPRLVKTWVAALARERLHKTRPSQAVKDEAERARSQLRDISRGVAKLPSEAGGTVEATGRAIADTTTSGDFPGSAFTDSALAGYGVPLGSEFGRWRS